ncbi:MAG TPA: diguanylate cyclase [Povalibacter sp.]|nr:diguanylate cyclase [Povalibacter sp.]
MWSAVIACAVGACLFLADVSAAAERHPAQALVDHASVAMRTDPETSRRDAEQALELLRRKPDADLEIRAHLILCDYQSERDTAAAEGQIALIETQLPQARRVGLRAGMLNCQGQIAETGGNNDKAREFYEKAVSVAADAGDNEMLAQALFARGYLLGLQGHYAAGLADLRRSQTLFEQIKLPQHALTAINGIAILYNRMGDYEQARHMYTQTLKLQREAKLYREQGVTLHNLGRAHENLREWDAARKAFQESLQISRDLHYSRGEAYALRGLAAVENGTGNPQAALEILDRAQALQRQTPDARLEAQINLARGIALHQLKQLPASVTALEDALQVFRQAASLSELRNTYSELAAVYSEMGNWRAGYGFLDKAGETAERQFRNQIDQRFATLKIEFDTAAKEKENALLLRENEANEKALAEQHRARSLQAAVIVLIVILAAVLLALALHQRRTSLRMRSLAMTDELTGVPNRRAVLAQLAPLLAQGERAACAMLIIDIDHFKSINDQHGHAEGDEALRLVAAKLRETVAAPGFVGRMGGEEFIAVLPDADAQRAIEVAESVRVQITTIDCLRWLSERRITVSIGVTVAASVDESAGSMLQRADAALYEAKRSGRNCVRVTAVPHAAQSPAGKPPEIDPGSIEYA